MFLSYVLSKILLTAGLVVLTLVVYFFWRRVLIIFLLFAFGLVVIFVPDQIAMSRWDELCRTDAGVKVYEKHAVSGFYFQGGGVEDAMAYLKRGYKYIEFDSKSPLGTTVVGTLTSGGSEISYSSKMALSKYKYSLNYYRVSNELSVFETQIVEIKSGKVIARIKKFYFFGGPVFRLIQTGRHTKTSDFISMCPRGPQIDSLVDSVIPPE